MLESLKNWSNLVDNDTKNVNVAMSNFVVKCLNFLGKTQEKIDVMNMFEKHSDLLYEIDDCLSKA